MIDEVARLVWRPRRKEMSPEKKELECLWMVDVAKKG